MLSLAYILPVSTAIILDSRTNERDNRQSQMRYFRNDFGYSLVSRQLIEQLEQHCFPHRVCLCLCIVLHGIFPRARANSKYPEYSEAHSFSAWRWPDGHVLCQCAMEVLLFLHSFALNITLLSSGKITIFRLVLCMCCICFYCTMHVFVFVLLLIIQHQPHLFTLKFTSHEFSLSLLLVPS